MKKIVLFTLLIGLVLVSLGPAPQDKKDIQAYVVKVIRDVNKRTPTSGWQKAVALDRLKSGYEVRTEKGSLAMILFADQSKLILREKSIVTIRGEVQGKQILSRDVHMDRGKMVFDVKKQEKEQFKFSSPISVASIRGTAGGYSSDAGQDMLTLTDGEVDFTNTISGRTVPVTSGNTGTADSSGSVGSRPATNDELNDAGNTSTDLPGGDTGDDQKQGETSAGIVVTGSTSFSPAPTAGIATTVEMDLSKTTADVLAVKLFYRTRGAGDFKSVDMTISPNSKIASFDVPADEIQPPAFEYYYTVTVTGNQTVELPPGGASNPGSVQVIAPVTSEPTATGISITATPVFSPSPVRSLLNLNVSLDLSKVTAKIDQVTFFYKKDQDGTFKQERMNFGGGIARSRIPAADVRFPGLFYYFVVKLDDSARTEISLPSDGESGALSLSVPELKRVLAEFEPAPLKSRNVARINVDLKSLETRVSAMTLYYKKENDASYKMLQLTVTGNKATGQIDAEDVRFPRIDYYMTLTLEDGSTITVPMDATSAPRFVGVQSVQRELRIPGQSGALQKKVLVIKWNE